jgi:ribosome-binding protein aMBF1 (putative translation factor)
LTASDADIATLDLVTEETEQTEWISPIGQSAADYFDERARRDPEFKRLIEEPRPLFDLAQAVGIRRWDLELSQRALARKAGIGPNVISCLEKETRGPTDEEISKLSKALDLDLTPFLPAPAERAA